MNSCTSLLYNRHKNCNLKGRHKKKQAKLQSSSPLLLFCRVTPLLGDHWPKRESLTPWYDMWGCVSFVPCLHSTASLTISAPHTICFRCKKLFVVPSLNKKLDLHLCSQNKHFCIFAIVLSSFWNVLITLFDLACTPHSDPAQGLWPLSN